MAQTAFETVALESPASKETGSAPVGLMTPVDCRTMVATGGARLALFLAITIFWILIFDREFLHQIVR